MRYLKKTLLTTLAVVYAMAVSAAGIFPKTEIGRKLLAEAESVDDVYTDTAFVVAPGIVETDLHIQKADGRPVRLFILDVDMTRPEVSLEVAMPDDRDVTSDFVRQTLTDMAMHADRPGHRVAAMINADFWDVKTMDIRGPIHRKGKVLKDTFIYKKTLNQQALSFVGLTNDNRMLIRDSIEYKSYKSKLKEVTGSGVIILRDGEVSGYNYGGCDPRTCIGYDRTGHVFFLVGDGRGEHTVGLTYPEMGSVMKALGCQWAVNLDGGGSSQFLIKEPATGSFRICNNPSDGKERPVVVGWSVILDRQ